MTLQQIKYIIKIVECGSITEAARQLYISQPSLSGALKELEAELGIEIFNRTSKGITLTLDGSEFLSYARQIAEQTDLLEQRYVGKKPSRQICSISTQHYAFAVNAFVNVIAKLPAEEYKVTLRETRTYEIIEDVKNYRSEIGVLYISEFNGKVISNLLRENKLKFTSLFVTNAHIFVCASHPLAGKELVTLTDLESYPCLTYEQGVYNSFYFAEELLSTVPHRKEINVSDRATLFNLLIGLNGYTICSGVLNRNLNGDNIVSVPLETDERMNVGWIMNEKAQLSQFAAAYIDELKRLIAEYEY